jgi:hypothetical protein
LVLPATTPSGFCLAGILYFTLLIRLPAHCRASAHFFSEISCLRCARDLGSGSTPRTSGFSAVSFAHSSAFSFPGTPLWAGYHRISMVMSGSHACRTPLRLSYIPGGYPHARKKYARYPAIICTTTGPRVHCRKATADRKGLRSSLMSRLPYGAWPRKNSAPDRFRDPGAEAHRDATEGRHHHRGPDRHAPVLQFRAFWSAFATTTTRPLSSSSLRVATDHLPLF